MKTRLTKERVQTFNSLLMSASIFDDNLREICHQDKIILIAEIFHALPEDQYRHLFNYLLVFMTDEQKDILLNVIMLSIESDDHFKE